MKIWLKILLAVLLGGVLGLLLPLDDTTGEILSFVRDVVVGLGRLFLLPLVATGVIIGTYELKREGRIGEILGRLFLVVCAVDIGVVFLALLSSGFLPLERIPILVEEVEPVEIPDIRSLLLSLVPMNFFEIFLSSGSFLLPVVLVGFSLGSIIPLDSYLTDPFVDVVDAANRVFYLVNAFVVEILPFGFVGVVAHFLYSLRGETDLSLYGNLLGMIGIFGGILFLLLVLVSVVWIRRGTGRWSLHHLPALFLGLFPGDGYFPLGFLIRLGKENGGVPRKVGALAYPVGILFARAGSAGVVLISFTVLLSSYSSLGLSPLDYLWLAGMGLLFLPLFGALPGSAVMVGLVMLSRLYGRGLDEAYLIFRPVFPLLVSMGTLLDVLCVSFLGETVAGLMGEREPIPPERHI
ncbi:transporter [Spirochaeta thermophila DSM 6578]|uniref:Transporter n=1 Tax=Winmispira thermophila (strain ATCC 700085 / DSM 6578 / Z-1203) TaxID=869211 RepID=G0GBF1_WINT7|nr:cation:dicarboxylase symporter family transporter [Spirochaeta thermophila]AEJ60310.1 transporter [Spirochaeta thermophila DSM 6578]